MKADQIVSDEYLNAFVDGQLSEADKGRLLALIEGDDGLRARVCELRSLKEMMQHAYALPPKGRRDSKRSSWSRPPYWQAIAASLLLLLGGASGWFAHGISGQGRESELVSLIQNVQRIDGRPEPQQFVIHVGSSNPVRLKSALDETESLLAASRRAGMPLRVEVIANGTGVDLLRADTSAYAQRIDRLEREYSNLDFMVCGQTLRNLRDKGVNVRLLPHTGVATSAVDQITRRLKQNWAYLRM